MQEVAHIANGSHPGNCISVLRVSVFVLAHFYCCCIKSYIFMGGWD